MFIIKNLIWSFIEKWRLITMVVIIVFIPLFIFFVPIETNILIDTTDDKLMEETINEISENLLWSSVESGEYKLDMDRLRFYKFEHMYWYVVKYYETPFHIYKKTTHKRIKDELFEEYDGYIWSCVARIIIHSPGHFERPGDPWRKVSQPWWD